ncbi:MAG: hypothetical protein HXX08_24160 [Chloroflexi bacterium]|uniref:Uncharacterized protein n=1 Tax=Candidatus Chlorohelix allophototropha TaxID=3003348 RepID=A0A8T7MA04_9CHLR|nr:hypothetical protein [Chloroflexota bacterium]WJW68896.1 hypothetical protein OZ401_004518 [Chloroflexota bacterium L227-S17]
MEKIKYELIPSVGIGPVRFGMTHQEVYEAMGTKPSTTLPRGKAVGEEERSSFHLHNCFAVHYSTENSTVEFIEVSSDCDIDVFYKDIDFFNTEVEELLVLLTKETPYDEDDPELGYSFIFPELELSLYRPHGPEDIEPLTEESSEEDIKYYEGELKRLKYIESVGLGITGYYGADWERLKEKSNQSNNYDHTLIQRIMRVVRHNSLD